MLQVGWGAWEAGIGHIWDGWPHQRDVSYHMMLWSAIKAGEGPNRHIWGCGVCFLSNHYVWWSLAFLDMIAHWLADGKWWKSPLFCFAYMYSFCYLIKLSLSQPTRFCPLDSLLHRSGGVSKWLGAAELTTGVNHVRQLCPLVFSNDKIQHDTHFVFLWRQLSRKHEIATDGHMIKK